MSTKRTTLAALLLLPTIAAAEPAVTEVAGRLGTVRLLASGPQRGDLVRVEFVPQQAGGIRGVCMAFDASTCNRFVPFAPALDLRLPEWDGSYYLSIFFQGSDRQPEIVNVPLVVDRTPPRLRLPSATRAADGVHLTWVAESTGRADGTLAVRVHATTSGVDPTCDGAPVWEGTGSEAVVTGLPPGEDARLRICVADAAGNVVASDVLAVTGADVAPPRVVGVRLADGAPAIGSRQVDLVVEANDDTGVATACVTHRSAPECVWVPFGPTLRTEVALDREEVVLYVRVADPQGHQTDAYEVVLPVDLAAPVVEDGAAAQGPEGVTVTFASLTDPHEPRVEIRAGAADVGCDAGVVVASGSASPVVAPAEAVDVHAAWVACAVDAVGHTAVIGRGPAPAPEAEARAR